MRSLVGATELVGKLGVECVDHRGAFQKGHQCRRQVAQYLFVEVLTNVSDGLLRVMGCEAE
ncbi:hypothetical protein D3C86_1848880 [compost metagenome]